MSYQLFTESLQHRQRLVQGDRHRDLGEVLADVPAKEVPEVDTGSVGLHGRKFDATTGVPGGLNCEHSTMVSITCFWTQLPRPWVQLLLNFFQRKNLWILPRLEESVQMLENVDQTNQVLASES